MTRQIAVFNDTFDGEMVELTGRPIAGGKKLAGGTMSLQIPLGSFVKVPVAFTTPGKGDLQLRLKVTKDGKTLFEEDAIRFEV